jgi:hypothetical protein
MIKTKFVTKKLSDKSMKEKLGKTFTCDGSMSDIGENSP